MSAARFPEDLEVTVEDFANSGWQDVVAGANGQGYVHMWEELHRAAKSATDAGEAAKGKVLWLLTDACSMMLKPKDHNNPFEPVMRFSHGRSAVTDDFSDADIIFFESILEHIDDPWLKGRLADILWLHLQPRKPDHALEAIDAYRSLGLDKDTWLNGSRECWERAISLASIMGDGAGDRLKEMGDAVQSAFEATAFEDGFLALWLSNLLFERRLALESDIPKIAAKLQGIADDHMSKNAFRIARDYYECAAKWYQAGDDSAKSNEMTVARAETWASEGKSRSAGDNPSYVVAASFYENAIQVYRLIPKTQRSAYQVDERIAELKKMLSDAGEKSHGELGAISTREIDITQMIKLSRDAVRGKDAEQALLGLVGLHRVDAKALRDLAIETIKEHPLSSPFATTVLGSGGRVVAKSPGAALDGSDSESTEPAIWFKMLQNYNITVGITVQGNILPAQEVLMQEHRLREHDFTWLAIQSPYIPKDRAKLWGAALYAGYNQDFVTAIHLLCPQVEHFVRMQLKNHGATTTTLDENGIENEMGLSALMKPEKVDDILPPDLVFEIRALFCDPIGSNLRNNIAHGLITHEGCFSASVVYAWWFCMGLVFIPYWNAKKDNEASHDEETEQSDGPSE